MARELWHAEYRRDAYLDQTGEVRDGYVVHEIAFVVDLNPGDHRNSAVGTLED